MKTKKLSKKLSTNKQLIASLNNSTMQFVGGGITKECNKYTTISDKLTITNIFQIHFKTMNLCGDKISVIACPPPSEV